MTRRHTVRNQPHRRSLRQSKVYFSVSYYEIPSYNTPSYNVLSELKDVKVGIEFKNLMNKTKVEKYDTTFTQ